MSIFNYKTYKMKKFLFLLLMCSSCIASAQVSSSCIVPQLLAQEYERDIKNLSIRRIIQLQSADTALVRIPQLWQDTIAEGLAAIFNATSIPERDSIFNLYCVHDNTTLMQTYHGLLVQVDTNYAWTQAWQNLNAITGNSFIDSLVVKYDLNVAQFFNWSFGNYALLHTDSLWNIYALIDSIEMEPGVIYGEPDQMIGGAGKMDYHTAGNDRYYDFYFEFNDCFDGCDNYRKWMFKVDSNCAVDYLGFVDWGVFGISPLPLPVNCNTFTSLTTPHTSNNIVKVYPNPTNSIVTIQPAEELKNASVSVLDVSGRLLIRPEPLDQLKILDLKKLQSGIYFLIIRQNNLLIETCKLVKD